MTRWLAFGAIGAAVVAGGVNGYERATDPTPAPSPPAATTDWGISPAEQHPIAPDELTADDVFQETATHEAGHVAASREFGIPVLEVTAEASGNGKTTYPDHYFPDPKRDAYAYAVIDAAGEESAVAWLEQRGYTHDRALAEEEPHANSDLDALRIDARQAGISVQEAHDQARRIVHDHRAAVDRTARALVERGGYLNEREIDD